MKPQLVPVIERYPIAHNAAGEKFVVGEKEYHYRKVDRRESRGIWAMVILGALVPLVAACFGGWQWLFLYTVNWIPVTGGIIILTTPESRGNYGTQLQAYAAAQEFATQCALGDRLTGED